MIKEIATLLASPAVISYWSVRYILGLSTPFDKCIPEKVSLSKIVILGILKRWGEARCIGLQHTLPENAKSLMLSKVSKYPNYSVEEGDIGYWMAKPKDFEPEVDPCFVYCHGGGYMFNMNASQLIYLKFLYESLTEMNPEKYGKLAVLVVDYKTTLNGEHYPSQFNHGIRTWKNLVEQGFRNISLIGDSAGAHMCLNILQWVSENNVVWPKNALLISPWLNPSSCAAENGLSMENEQYDYITADSSFNMGNLYYKNVNNPWKNPHINIGKNATLYNWKGMPTKFLLTAGSHEVLLKSIIEFSKIIDSPLAIEKGGMHDGPVMYEPLFYSTREEWMKSFGGRTSTEFFGV